MGAPLNESDTAKIPLFMEDPDWAGFIPDVKSGGPRCRMPSHEDCTPLDEDAAVAHIAPGGTLGGMAGYEARPGQMDMLRAVVRAFNGRTHLMVEAGTGVGKSLAYLIPAVLWSYFNDTPVIVSTATRNLQSQLLGSDLPRATMVLGEDAPKLRVAALKGRTNYLCLRMLAELMQCGWWALTNDEKEDFSHLYRWLHRTDDGDLDDLGLERMRPHLSCPGEDCAGRTCYYREKCFIARARNRAQQAHIVVANHALVLAEATSPASTLLPAYGRLVFDEAHNLEDMATEFLSWELSRPALVQLLGRLSRTSRSRHGVLRERGVLGAVERQLKRGILRENAHADEIRELLTRAQVQTRFAVTAGDGLFEVLRRLFSPAPKGTDRIRFRCVPTQTMDADGKPRMARQHSLHGLFADYTPAQWNETDLEVESLHLENALAKLQNILVHLGDALKNAASDGEAQIFQELAVQVIAAATAIRDFMLEGRMVLAASDPSRVYWAEMPPGGGTRKAYSIRVIAAPLSVAEEMKKLFLDPKDSVVLCSATLRTGDKFDYMARKLGMALLEPSRVNLLTAASPFNYFRQSLVLAPDCLPDPSASPKEYAERLAPFLVELFKATRGRGLALFTSYEMMDSVAELVRPAMDDAGMRLLVQGDDLSRETMTAILKSAIPDGPPVVLFGAQSFWEGVDVPGEALSCVVLARLPFPQVGEPMVEARGEKVTENGGSSFRDYMLPEAIIRFRQGFGRLVRTRTDKGVVVIADSRIGRKNYGAMFRKSIPATVHMVKSEEEVVAMAAEFLE